MEQEINICLEALRDMTVGDIVNLEQSLGAR